MGFQDSADSLRARLHLGNVSPAVLIGVIAVACVALACATFAVVSATASHVIEVEKSEANTVSSSSATDGLTFSEEGSSEASIVVVYVSGAVVKPGVYELSSEDRVNDAIRMAGGFTEDADRFAVNLARAVVDGEQISVPVIGAVSAASTQGSASATVSLVNINTASAEELDALEGIGESTAQKIIADREANGPFTTIEDLMRVSGIGEKKFEALKDRITV